MFSTIQVLALLLWLSFSYAFYSEADCRAFTAENIAQLTAPQCGLIGADCIKGLGEQKTAFIRKQICIENIHVSAFTAMGGMNFAVLAPELAERFFGDPNNCDFLTTLDHIKSSSVHINDDCFDKIQKKPLFATLTFKDLGDFAAWHSSFLPSFRAKYDVEGLAHWDYYQCKMNDNAANCGRAPLDLSPIFENVAPTDHADSFGFLALSLADAFIKERYLPMFGNSFSLDGGLPSSIFSRAKYIINKLNMKNAALKYKLMDLITGGYVIDSIIRSLENEYSASAFMECFVSKMATNDEIMVPHGFIGHSTVAHFKKIDGFIILHYFNTGGGINYHARKLDNHGRVKYSHKMSFKIPDGELNRSFWSNWISINYSDIDGSSIKLYENVLASLPPNWHIESFDASDVFIAGQIGGSCSFKSLSTWMRFIIGSETEYQIFKFHFLTTAYQEFSNHHRDEFLKERHALSLLTLFGNTIERIAEYLVTESSIDQASRDSIKLRAGKASDLKKAIYNTLQTQLKASNPSFNMLKIEPSEPLDNFDFSGREDDIKAIKNMFGFVNSDDNKKYDRAISLNNVSFSTIIWRIYNAIERSYSNSNIYSFVIEFILTSIDLDQIKQPGGGKKFINENDIPVLIKILSLIYNKLMFSREQDHDERYLAAVKVYLFIWKIYGLLQPEIMNYRPSIPVKQFSVFLQSTYYQSYEDIKRFLNEKTRISFYGKFSTIGLSESEPTQLFFNIFFNPIKDIARTSKNCDSHFPKDVRYYKSPILLLPSCRKFEPIDPSHAKYLEDYSKKYLDEHFSFLIKLGIQLEGKISTAPQFFEYENYSLFFEHKTEKDASHSIRLETDKFYPHVPSDYAGFAGLNSIIVGLDVDPAIKNSPIVTKLQITIGFLFKLNAEMRHYQAICYLAARPKAFSSQAIINSFIYPLSPTKMTFIFNANQNLVEAWLNMIESTFKYHDVMHSGTKHKKNMLGMQEIILFGIHLVAQHSSSSTVGKKVATRLTPLIDAFQLKLVQYEDYEKLFVDGFMMKTYLAFFKRDYEEFTVNFFLSATTFKKVSNFSRNFVMHRLIEDLIGAYLSEAQMIFTPDFMKAAALKVIAQKNLCDLTEGFDWLQGGASFPDFKAAGCHINFISRHFSRVEPTEDFSIHMVQKSRIFFDSDHLATVKIDSNNSCTVADINYIFIKVGNQQYEAVRYFDGIPYLYSQSDFLGADLSVFQYNLWNSESHMKVFRHNADTLKVEFLLEIPINGDTIIFADAPTEVFHRKESPTLLMKSFFPTNVIVHAVPTSASFRARNVIMNFADPSGKQLVIEENDTELFFGTEYRILKQDLYDRKYPIYKLDLFSLLILESNFDKVALIPHLYVRDYLGYSNKAFWLQDQSNVFNPNDIRYAVKTSLVPIDEKGTLKPSNREDTLLVALIYFYAYEFEMAAYYLKLIPNTSPFSNHEIELLNWIIADAKRDFPDCSALKTFAAWIWYSNYLMFSDYKAPKNPDVIVKIPIDRQNPLVPSSCASCFWANDSNEINNLRLIANLAFQDYFAYSNHVSKEMRIEPSADFEQSLLSAGEYRLFLEKFSLSRGAKPKSIIVTSTHIRLTDVTVPSSFDRAARQIVQSLSAPKSSSVAAVDSLIKFMVDNFDAKLKDKFCDIFKFNGTMLSGWQRFITRLCYSNDVSVISDLRKSGVMDSLKHVRFSFDLSGAKVPDISPSVTPNLNQIIKLESLKDASLLNVETNLINLYFEKDLNDFLANCHVILTSSGTVLDCSKQTAYVDKYICEGKNELQTREFWRQKILNLIGDPSFNQVINAIKTTINTLDVKIKNNLGRIDNIYGIFNGNATYPRQMSDINQFNDQFLIRLIRSGNVQFLQKYFGCNTEAKQKDMLEYIFKHFELTIQKQRLERLLSNFKSPESKIDFIIEDVSRRPDDAPFRKEIILLEYILNLRMRAANFKALQTLLDGSILQRVMGGGKTLVLGTLMIALLDAAKIALLIPPSALLKTNAGNTLAMNFSGFGQRGHVITASRCSPMKDSYDHCVLFYDYINVLLENCTLRDEYIMSSKETIMAFYNNYKEALLKNLPTKYSLQRIITKLKTDGFAIFDEVDSIFAPFFELNYPISVDIQMDKLLGRAIIAAFDFLVSDAELIRIYNILDTSAIISPPTYQALKVALTAKLAENEEYKACMAHEDEQDSEYLCRKQFQRFLDSTLEDCLSTKQNVKFGVLPELSNSDVSSLEQFSKPFLGSNTPSYASQFSDQNTSLTYTLLSYLRQDLFASQKDVLFKDLLNEAEMEFSSHLSSTLRKALVDLGSGNDAAIDNTRIAKTLDIICDEKMSFSKCISKSDSNRIAFLETKCFHKNKSRKYIFAYVEHNVLPSVTLNEEQISSSAQDLLYLFDKYVGYSGTIYNLDVFDEGKPVEADNVALGTIMSQVVDKNTLVLEFDKGSTISQVLNKAFALNPSFQANIKAVIDTAALFNDFDNKALGEECMRVLGLDGALYFATGKDDLFFTDTANSVVSVKRTDPRSLFDITKLQPERRITIYDEIHTRGVDIIQHADAVALVTVGLSTKLSDLLQGILRMRGFLAKQQIIFVLSSTEAIVIKEKMGITTALTAKDILQWTFTVQSNDVIGENQTVFFQKLKSYLDNASIAQNTGDSLKTLKSTHEFDLIQMRSSFPQKVINFWNLKAPLLATPHIKSYVDAFKENWKDKVATPENERVRTVMTKNIERVAEMDVVKEAEEVKQDEEELEIVTTQVVVLTGQEGFTSLSWNFDSFFSVIDDAQIIATRSTAELISWKAIISRPSMSDFADIYFRSYFSSNFVQVDKNAVHANISFRLESTDIRKRRSQFGFYILIWKFAGDDGKDEYRYIFFEPQEAESFLAYANANSVQSKYLISSNGDVVYPPKTPVNLLILYGKGKTLPEWDVKRVVENISFTCYKVGMIELFSTFSLAELVNALELATEKEQFKAAALLESDTELATSLLPEVLHSFQNTVIQTPKWLRHIFALAGLASDAAEDGPGSGPPKLYQDKPDVYIPKKDIPSSVNGSKNDEDGKSNLPLILGLCFGILGLILVAAGAFFAWRHYKAKKEKATIIEEGSVMNDQAETSIELQQ